jgi:hypothetical protein
MSDLLKSLQDAKVALQLEYAKKMEALDSTIALFSNGTQMSSSKTTASNVVAVGTEKPAKGKPGPKPKGFVGEVKAKPEKKKEKVRLNSKQIEQDGLSVLEGNRNEAFTLDEVAKKILLMQGLNPVFHDQVKRAVYLSFVNLNKDGVIKKTKKEGNNKIDYYSV